MPARACGIDLDAHRGLLAAADEDLPDAVHLRDLLREDGVGGVEDLRQRQRVAREREDEDGRVGRVDLAVGRLERQVGGSSPPAAAIAACTSRAAASTLRSRSNWSVIDVEPSVLVDVISVEPGDAPEAPLERRGDRRGHRLGARARAASALTWMVGKSTRGSGATGSRV